MDKELNIRGNNPYGAIDSINKIFITNLTLSDDDLKIIINLYAQLWLHPENWVKCKADNRNTDEIFDMLCTCIHSLLNFIVGDNGCRCSQEFKNCIHKIVETAKLMDLKYEFILKLLFGNLKCISRIMEDGYSKRSLDKEESSIYLSMNIRQLQECCCLIIELLLGNVSDLYQTVEDNDGFIAVFTSLLRNGSLRLKRVVMQLMHSFMASTEGQFIASHWNPATWTRLGVSLDHLAVLVLAELPKCSGVLDDLPTVWAGLYELVMTTCKCQSGTVHWQLAQRILKSLFSVNFNSMDSWSVGFVVGYFQLLLTLPKFTGFYNDLLVLATKLTALCSCPHQIRVLARLHTYMISVSSEQEGAQTVASLTHSRASALTELLNRGSDAFPALMAWSQLLLLVGQSSSHNQLQQQQLHLCHDTGTLIRILAPAWLAQWHTETRQRWQAELTQLATLYVTEIHVFQNETCKRREAELVDLCLLSILGYLKEDSALLEVACLRPDYLPLLNLATEPGDPNSLLLLGCVPSNKLTDVREALFLKIKPLAVVASNPSLLASFFSLLQSLCCSLCLPPPHTMQCRHDIDRPVLHLACPLCSESMYDKMGPPAAHYKTLLDATVNLVLKIITVSCQTLLYDTIPYLENLIERICAHCHKDWTENSRNTLVSIFRASIESSKISFNCNISHGLDHFAKNIFHGNVNKWLPYLHLLIKKIDELFEMKIDHGLYYVTLLLKSILMYTPMVAISNPMKSICKVAYMTDEHQKAVLRSMLPEVMAFRKKSFKQIIKHCGLEFAEMILSDFEEYPRVIKNIAYIFNDSFQRIFQILLTPFFILLAMRGDKRSQELLESTNAQYRVVMNNTINYKTVYSIAFPESLAYLILNTKGVYFNKSVMFIEAVYEQPIRKAMSSMMEQIIHQLVLHLDDKYLSVRIGLSWIMVVMEQRNVNTPPLSVAMLSSTNQPHDDVGGFLVRYSVGILDLFKKQLLRPELHAVEKERIVGSLEAFVKLLGADRMKNVRTMYFNILKICMKFDSPNLLGKTYSLWADFLKTFDIEDLQSMLVESIAILVHRNINQNLIEILQYLFTRKKELHAILRNLHFILMYPELAKFHEVYKKVLIKQSRDKIAPSTQIKSITQQQWLFTAVLGECANGLGHDSAVVRRLAGLHLHSVLAQHTGELLPWLLRSLYAAADPESSMTAGAPRGLVHRLTRRLVHALAALRRGHNIRGRMHDADDDDDDDSAIAYGRCLGLLGSVDPGRYLEVIDSENETSPQEFVDSSNFPYLLLHEVARQYISITNSNLMDNCALAIQELLKAFGVSEVSVSASSALAPEDRQPLFRFAFHQHTVQGFILWEMFSRQVKEIFQPFMKSRFVQVSVDFSTTIRPIFSQESSWAYESWICIWTSYLIHKMEIPEHRRIFECVKSLAHMNSQFATFILPHIVLVVLIENSAVNLIEEEFRVILDDIVDDDEDSVINSSNFLNTTHNFLGNSNFSTKDSANSLRLFSAGQTIFNIVDYLRKWLDKEANKIVELEKSLEKKESGEVEVLNKNYQSVKSFVHRLPNSLLAGAAYRCGSLARAVQYWELAYAYMPATATTGRQPSDERKAVVTGLLHAHRALNNTDEISGYLSCFKTDLEPFAHTLHLEYEGKFDQAQLVYEQKLLEYSHDTDDTELVEERLDVLRSVVRCQMCSMPQLASAVSRLESCLHQPDVLLHGLFHTFNDCRVEALAKMGDWNRLEQALDLVNCDSENWNVSILRPIILAKNKQHDECQDLLARVWSRQLGNLQTVAIEGGSDYERLHGDLARLSTLTDLETVLAARSSSSSVEVPRFLRLRYDLSEARPECQESLLVLHQHMLQLLVQLPGNGDRERLVSELWLQRSKVARRRKCPLSALYCLINVKHNLFKCIVQKAKVFWKQNEMEEALAHLDRTALEVLKARKDQSANPPDFDSKQFGKLLLLRAHLSDLARRHDPASARQLYSESLHFIPDSEAAHFRFADFLDRCVKVAPAPAEELIVTAVEEYGNALQYGSKNVYQSMPRLLSLWLDQSNNVRPANDTLYQKLRVLVEKVPKFQFFIALNQILSRLCHETTRPKLEILVELATDIFIEYPHQTVWALMTLAHSKFQKRKDRFNVIFTAVRRKQSTLTEYINKVVILGQALRTLSELEDNITDGKAFRIKKKAKFLQSVLESKSFTDVLIPLHHQMYGQLPSSKNYSSAYWPFPSPSSCIYIASIKDEVEVLPSLTRPKKTVWLGSDGRSHIIVAKPKDDLRRDSRIMELNAMFNRLMRDNAETRQKMLYIRTYAVTPLGEQSGLIEWVNNTVHYRGALLQMCSLLKINVNVNTIRSKYAALEDTNEEKLRKFVWDVMPLFPTVLHQWFQRRFVQPSRWFRATHRFSRSTAVMSMVGYVLGLGDRHVENMLLDCVTGDLIHIDFNCLFNHGTTLLWPEVVPFRLTRNMLDGLGPCRQHNGVFRGACEATLRLLRAQIESIMAVFRPMYHDTLVEIKAASSGSGRNPHSRAHNTNTALTEERLDCIESRLRGVFNNHPLPMSVEGQLENLLAAATDQGRLSRMYIGWASYM